MAFRLRRRTTLFLLLLQEVLWVFVYDKVISSLQFQSVEENENRFLIHRRKYPDYQKEFIQQRLLDPDVAILHRPRSKRNVTHLGQLLPDANLIGVAKCGSTATMFFMDMHPQIATVKAEAMSFTDNFEKGLDFWDDRYAKVPAGRFILEKSVDYWKWAYREPDVIQRRIKRTYKAYGKAVKLILVVCDPTLRTLSNYAHHCAVRGISMTLAGYLEYLKALGVLTTGNSKPQLESCYDQVIPLWFQHFDRGQIHIIDGENLKKNPYEEIKSLERFLGLEDFLTPSMFRYDEAKGYYCKWINNASVCMQASKGRKHQSISPELMERVKRVFRPHNNRFFTIIGKDFEWQ